MGGGGWVQTAQRSSNVLLRYKIPIWSRTSLVVTRHSYKHSKLKHQLLFNRGRMRKVVTLCSAPVWEKSLRILFVQRILNWKGYARWIQSYRRKIWQLLIRDHSRFREMNLIIWNLIRRILSNKDEKTSVLGELALRLKRSSLPGKLVRANKGLRCTGLTWSNDVSSHFGLKMPLVYFRFMVSGLKNRDKSKKFACIG